MGQEVCIRAEMKTSGRAWKGTSSGTRKRGEEREEEGRDYRPYMVIHGMSAGRWDKKDCLKKKSPQDFKNLQILHFLAIVYDNFT